MEVDNIDWVSVLKKLMESLELDDVDKAIEDAIKENKCVMYYPEHIQ